MIKEDTDLIINVLDEIEKIRDLSDDEKNFLERMSTIVEFDKAQDEYNEKRKAFNEKMESLTKKAGE